MREERDSLKRECERLQCERDAMQLERDTLVRDKEQLLAELNNRNDIIHHLQDHVVSEYAMRLRFGYRFKLAELFGCRASKLLSPTSSPSVTTTWIYSSCRGYFAISSREFHKTAT